MSTRTLNISNLGSVTFTRSQRAKYQRITIRPDKTITVTIPRRGSIDEAKQFLKSKISWIQKQLQKIDQRAKPQDATDLNIDLEKSQMNLFNRAKKFSEDHSIFVKTEKELYDYFQSSNPGFAYIYWNGDETFEEKIKQDLNVTIRCLPLDKEEKAGNRIALIAKAY